MNAGSEVIGACPSEALGRCATVTTFLPVFSSGKPADGPTGGATIQACYYDHPDIKYSNLERTGLVPYDKSAKSVWINTGCAKACATADVCSALTTNEKNNVKPSQLSYTTIQRCVLIV